MLAPHDEVTSPTPGLEALVHAELADPGSGPCPELEAEIRARYGASLKALLFYGSCLRKGSPEGVLDFYAIVSDYASIIVTRWFPRPRWTPRPRGNRKPNKQETKDGEKKAE